MALIKAWLIESNNPIRGTDQSGKEFWSRVLKSWQRVLQGETDARVKAPRDQRGFEALRKQWAKMVAGVMEFSSCIVQARLAKPTGIATHADLVNCAEGILAGQTCTAASAVTMPTTWPRGKRLTAGGSKCRARGHSIGSS